ncbi:protein kinase [Mesorhizobium sp. YR577]|uniref:protein kinase domain-containing protein n=1 Tax=Mesorhizobium sp. YR577 TaxID=1884373 RepID=UPI0008F1C51B|nr:protein kinase [Mesorhizobium sp. YR577]SFU10854.1 serine/threonine protein kinase [Mesorhizobium sp. YR577]
MSADQPPDGLNDIAARFSELWRALSHDGDAPREPAETGMLADRVRDALDRRLSQLNEANAIFIANTFVVEAVVHDGMPAQVHRVRHRDLQTLHALKTLRPDHADDAVSRDLLLREARLSMKISHPNVASVHTALRLADGRPALIAAWMPFTLSDCLNTQLFSPREIRQAMISILSGVEAVHAAGLIHADIAPDNLLLSGEDLKDLKIADFGIALERGQRHGDLDLAAAGHSEFSAPEQMEGMVLDGRADLYACGLILTLLLERCEGEGRVQEKLAVLAGHLSQQERKSRPENVSAALRLLMKIDI